MTRQVEGDVARLRCGSCGAITHNVIFSGESDMATMGLVSLASTTRPEVVVAEAVEEELRHGFGAVGLSTQRRVSAALIRADLRYLAVLRTEVQGNAAGSSFQAFRSAYQPPQLIYACPHCAAGEAITEASQSFEDFERDGGILTTFGDVSLKS